MRVMRFLSVVGVTAWLAAGVVVAQGAVASKPIAQQPAAEKSPGAGPIIVVETEKGTFEFETYPKEAPKTVKHILGLVSKKFYNGQRVHRVEPNFVIQMGDPQSRDMTKKPLWGTGGSGTKIGTGEPSKLRTHVRGAVGIAYAKEAANADSQFYVTLRPTPQLDGAYTVFGKVIAGMDVVQKTEIGDRIIRVTVKDAK
jgi:cyclophilin family peptidyl-prolyl cis-trans isomerase